MIFPRKRLAFVALPGWSKTARWRRGRKPARERSCPGMGGPSASPAKMSKLRVSRR